jgi:hypothetical protein
VLLLTAQSAVAAPPPRGVFAPGESLGGLRLGMTKAQVRAAWGTDFGRCRNCARETWYFNYRPFTPQGAGVVFQRGRAYHVFTLWQPAGWRTTKGLTLGALEGQVTQAYGTLQRRSCRDYDALVLRSPEAQNLFYIHEGVLWGFGLTRPESDPCL